MLEKFLINFIVHFTHLFSGFIIHLTYLFVKFIALLSYLRRQLKKLLPKFTTELSGQFSIVLPESPVNML